MSNYKSAFAKRVGAAGLTLKDVSFIANVSYKRIHLYSMGQLELTPEEMERVNTAVSHGAVVYTIYQRALEEVKTAIRITTVEGVMTVAAEEPEKRERYQLTLEDRRRGAAAATKARKVTAGA